MQPIGLSASIVLGLLILYLPKRMCVYPMLLGVLYFPISPVLTLGGLSFSVMRFLATFGLIRFVREKERPARFNCIDKAILVWTVLTVITGTILGGDLNAFVNRAAAVYDILGTYLFFRLMVRDLDDVTRIAKFIIIIIIPVAISMLIEYKTGRNFFSHLGGVPDLTVVRNGKLRCQGPFMHPILAGTSGATLIPLIVALHVRKNLSRTLSILSIFACLSMVTLANSTGAIAAALLCFFGMGMWFARRHVNKLLVASMIGLFLLQLVMKAPVWYLISKIDLTGSSTSWHRSELINSAIVHFDEWWLVGTNHTRHWMPTGVTWSPNHADITNEYIKIGVRGGAFTLLAYLGLAILLFRKNGRLVDAYSARRTGDGFMVWSFGTILFAHAITFLSTSYFDQIISQLYMLYAIIASIDPPSDFYCQVPGALDNLSVGEAEAEAESEAAEGR